MFEWFGPSRKRWGIPTLPCTHSGPCSWRVPSVSRATGAFSRGACSMAFRESGRHERGVGRRSSRRYHCDACKDRFGTAASQIRAIRGASMRRSANAGLGEPHGVTLRPRSARQHLRILTARGWPHNGRDGSTCPRSGETSGALEAGAEHSGFLERSSPDPAPGFWEKPKNRDREKSCTRCGEAKGLPGFRRLANPRRAELVVGPAITRPVGRPALRPPGRGDGAEPVTATEVEGAVRG